MSPKTVAEYGSWESPISADLVSAGSNPLMEVEVNTKTGAIYIVEGRPSEGGRQCIVEINGRESRDVIAAPYSAKSSIHSYGGGAVAISPDGKIIFTNSPTNDVFILDPVSCSLEPAVEASRQIRYGDFSIHPTQPQYIIAVQEEHYDSGHEAENRIVLIDASSKAVTRIAEGADFYAHPRFNPDGSRICWIQWQHPDMPWHGTELYVTDFPRNGAGDRATYIAGAAGTESICQPRWGDDGTLFFVTDRSGFSQLYVLEPGKAPSDARSIAPKGYEDAEFAGTEGRLRNHTYIPLTDDTIVAGFTRNATSGLLLINHHKGTHEELDVGISDIERNAMRKISATSFVVLGIGPMNPKSAYIIDISSTPIQTFYKWGSADLSSIPIGNLSMPEHISFPRTHGSYLEGQSYAIFTPPRNTNFEAPQGSKPPLIVYMHGGPRTHVTPALSLDIQYWTSRGYAHASVNYGGSSGYGRAYRDMLDGNWGVLDAGDAVSCVSYLALNGKIDSTRVGITGQSAGGYSVLQSLVLYPDIWAGGASHFGIGDLKKLDELTHKFESHYLPGLIFGRGMKEKVSPEQQVRLYRERSPCFHAEKIKSPVLLLQGTEDAAVPMSQATEMEEVLEKNGTQVKLVLFEGEGHGFAKKENLKTALLEEEKWWRKTLLRL